MASRRGQVLAFFAVALTVVLLPVAAYAVDAATAGAAEARLQEATSQAALEAAQQLGVNALRSQARITVDASAASRAALDIMAAQEPAASVRSVVVAGPNVTVTTDEIVHLPFDFFPVPAVHLEAQATARLTSGYDRPSSRLPLPTSSF